MKVISFVFTFAISLSTPLVNPTLIGVSFKDAYRYMDWLLTVSLLLIEILLVMKLYERDFADKSKALELGSALMLVLWSLLVT